ncbi:MAG: alcohol dehydrogenase catalytic domain-containing protein [Phycisphaerales bacterium]
MRAIVSDGGVIRLQSTFAEPVASPGEALVRVRLAGVSEIDAAIADAPSIYAGVPGHEAVGVVQSVNIPADAPQAVRERKALVGKRVFVWPHVVCGHCELCRSGLSAHCRVRVVLGMPGRGVAAGRPNVAARAGCLAELVAVPISNLVELPASLGDDTAVLGVTVARAMHVKHVLGGGAAGAGLDAYVTVIGDSLLALLIAHVLSGVCPSVRVLTGVERRGGSDAAGRLLERWRVKHRPAEEAGRRQDQHVVIDATGTSGGLKLALQHVRPRGLIILKSRLGSPGYPPGSHFPDPSESRPEWLVPIDLTPIVSSELRVAGSGDGSASEAVHAMSRGEYDLSGLAANRIRPEAAVSAMKNLGSIEPFKCVVEF